MNTIEYIQELQNLLIICPCCGEIYKVSELKIFYQGKAKENWYNKLIEKDRLLTIQENRFEDRKEKLREKAMELGRKNLMKYLYKADKIIKPLKYFPQDIKAILSPIDFVVFDGMNQSGHVKQIVFLDRNPDSQVKEKIHTSLKKTIKSGNYEWVTISLNDEGKLIPSWKYYSFPNSKTTGDEYVKLKLSEDEYNLLIKLKNVECDNQCPVYKDCIVYEDRKENGSFCKELFTVIKTQNSGDLHLTKPMLNMLKYLLDIYKTSAKENECRLLKTISNKL